MPDSPTQPSQPESTSEQTAPSNPKQGNPRSLASNPNNLPPDKYARLREEALHPYRGLRRFFYGAFAASGAIGGVVFLARILAGREVMAAIPNLALQVGVVALMVWLLRRDVRRSQDP